AGAGPRGGTVTLTLAAPAPGQVADPYAHLRGEADKEIAKLRESEAGRALLAQRQLLAESRGRLARARSAVSSARAEVGAALAKGKPPDAAEAELKSSLSDVDLLSERLASLGRAIEGREGDVAAAWGPAALAVMQRVR